MRAHELLEAKHGTFYYKAGEKLPPDVVEKFDALAKQQRGTPEAVMMQITQKYEMMWINHLLEHIGDLIHGYADSVNFEGKVVRDNQKKIEDGIRALSNLQANMNELSSSIDHMVKTGKVKDKGEYFKSFIGDCESYAAAHSQLPCYNEIHKLCKNATVSLGGMQFEECLKHLQQLHKYYNDGSIFKRHLEVTRGKNGQLKVIG